MCFLDHTQLKDITDINISPIEKNDDVSTDIITAYKHNLEILERAAKDYTNMTVQDVINTMFVLIKESSRYTEEELQNIKQHIGFLRMWEVLNRNVRFMKMNEIINSLKILTIFKIPATCILTQSLLQIIRTKVNNISLENIMQITTLVKKMDSTPLSDALMIALPIVFEAQLPTKLNSDDINMLTHSFRFINEINLNNLEIQNMILKLLQKFENNLNVQTAWSIFCNLCITSYLPPMAFELLFNVHKILISDVKQLKIPKIMTALRRLVFVTSRKYVSSLQDSYINISFLELVCKIFTYKSDIV